MDSVKIGLGKNIFLQDLDNFELHNNVSIICGDGVKVKGNSLLLASISPWLYKLIKEQSHEEEITIITPDIQSENVAHLMQTLQSNLTNDTSIECIINENTFKTLFKPNSEIKLPFCKVDLVDIKCENEEFIPNGDGNDHYECEDDDVIMGQPDDILDNDIEPKKLPNDDLQHAVEETNNDRKNIVKKQGKKEKFCDLCNCMVVLLGKVTMKKHYKSVHEQTTVNCPYCQKPFLTKTYLPSHVKKHHASENSLILCSKCGFSTNSFDEYTKHDKIHTKHLCDICNKMFVDVGLHKRRKHEKISEKTSEICSEKHSENANNFKSEEHSVCFKCGKSFHTKNSLHIHMQYVHNKEISNCDKCGKDFEGPYRLQDHIRSVHRPKPCPICGTMFQNLRLHMHTVHREEKDKKYVCDICGKGFLQKDKLNGHNMSVHIKARPFNCRYGCSFSYNDYRNRNAHEKKKHGGLFTDKHCTISTK